MQKNSTELMNYNFDKQIDRRGSLSLKFDALESVFGRDDLFPMWIADMDFQSPPAILESVKEALDRGIFGYSFRSSDSIDHFINWVAERYNWSVNGEWITSSPGIVTALALAIRVYTNIDDKVLIQTPVYPPFHNVIKENNRQLVTSPLIEREDSWEIDWEDFENKLSGGIKMFVLCSSHNPIGKSWSREELEKMGNLCERYGVLIFSDEIHADLALYGNVHIPIASISEKIAELTITAMAPSKTFNIAGVLNSVIVISSPKLRTMFQDELDKLHLGLGNIFGHITMGTAYQKGGEWLDNLKPYLERNIDYAQEFLKRELPQIKFIKPQSSFLLWLDFRGTGLSHENIKERLINVCRLGLNDGMAFGQEGEFFFRMNIGTPLANVQEGLNRLKAGFTSL